MYPGATPAEPMSSIRLECIRDGEEDYEYFVRLDRLIADAEKAGRGGDAAVAAARTTRQAAQKLVADMTGYEKRPAPYLKIREQVADAIEQLQRLSR